MFSCLVKHEPLLLVVGQFLCNPCLLQARTLGPGKKKGMGRGPVERKRGPKPKLKQCGGTGYSIDAKNSDDDPSSTTIIVSSKDKFSLHNDVCYSCGTIGKDEEGKLIVCTQCGQCYHPYCVSIKVRKHPIYYQVTLALQVYH